METDSVVLAVVFSAILMLVIVPYAISRGFERAEERGAKDAAGAEGSPVGTSRGEAI